MLPHIARILDAARIAPSRDNLQPWRFSVDGEAISFFIDEERDRSPLNVGGWMARVALGAAIECALLRAGRMGTTVRFVTPAPGALVTLVASSPKRDPEPDKALIRRATNRRLYDGRPIDDATFNWLRDSTPAVDATRTLWFGRERVRLLGPIIEEGETLFYGDPRLRASALQAVRFDVRDREEVTHGLSLGSLELSGPERVTIDTLRRTPQDRLAAMGAFKKMGARARKLMESASGVCVVTARGWEPATDVAIGRSMQRAWLALTRRDLVAEPMTAIPGLEAMLAQDPSASFEDAPRVTAVVDSFRGAFPGVDRGSRIAFVMRVGFAAPPTVRVARLALEESVVPPSSPGSSLAPVSSPAPLPPLDSSSPPAPEPEPHTDDPSRP